MGLIAELFFIDYLFIFLLFYFGVPGYLTTMLGFLSRLLLGAESKRY